MNTIIFLDVDGVLRTHKSDLDWSVKTGLPIPKIVFDRLFDPIAVSNINWITQITRAKIVVSSTWRVKHDIDQLRKIFLIRGISADIIDKTGIGLNRGEEILNYVDENNITDYVVIDDQVADIVRFIDPKRVIKCDSKIGFTDEELVEKTIDILS